MLWVDEQRLSNFIKKGKTEDQKKGVRGGFMFASKITFRN